ncbi:c-type cytochrome biogenesis protein CcmI [Bordetella petrii]|uniref:Cytochrome C-type biogenesis protein n=1 Tax=Bordetella petrii (strain ATCC BAA-461 / DSM 12804 / CCUG 43448 / CIP 107267 / Se-1111R) TaxID=340100 RepID=A9I317_BORPD|nr:c-type cytochrome biogenesis protein CcmI [Bordetella petrii]CAP44120.1 Cytochrome C-type biogenesis protein [Bordetella petrii]
MTLIFVAIAVMLAAAVTLWLGRTLWRGHTSESQIEHHAVNAAVLRDQLAELEQDVVNQTLSVHDFSAAKQEIQQRVLHEAVPGSVPVLRGRGDKRAAVALIVVLPLATILLYLSLGNPAATLPLPSQSVPMMTQADMKNMVESLEARLAQNADEPAGWLMLARSYRYFGQYKDAVAAFSKAAPIIQTDPLALTEYAETLARSSGTGFTREAMQLLERALILDPREPFALTLAGTAALERGDRQVAIEYWRQVLDQIPVGSKAAQIVADGIERTLQENGNARIP